MQGRTERFVKRTNLNCNNENRVIKKKNQKPLWIGSSEIRYSLREQSELVDRYQEITRMQRENEVDMPHWFFRVWVASKLTRKAF